MLDLIGAELHRKAIANLTNEAALALVKTSGSPGVTFAKDLSTCLLDAKGEQLGLSAYILFHSASSVLGTRAVIDQLAKDGLEPRPGDGWILNDPYKGGAQHQGDVGMIQPLFYHGELVGWAFANVHVRDIGGSGVSGFSPGARSVYEEGLRFPVTQVIRDGKLETAWERYIAQNVRAPAQVINDIRSMIAANNTAQSKLIDIIDHFGMNAHLSFSGKNKELSETLLRSRIAKIPDGVYESADYIEFDGHGVEDLFEIRCRLTVAGTDLKFAFSGAPQTDALVNGSAGPVYGNTMTMILTTLAYGDLPFNAGMWRPITIDIGPPGTVVNASSPAPVSLGHAECGKRVGKAVKKVLNQALSMSEDPTLRSRVAGLAGDCGVVTALFGKSDGGDLVVFSHSDILVGIGGGAQTVADGLDTYGSTAMAGCGLPDMEPAEASYPVVFLWRRVAINSAGPGQMRGGQGLDRAYLLRDADSLTGVTASFNQLVPVTGFGGGAMPRAAAQYCVRTARGEQIFHSPGPPQENLGGTKEQITLKDGALVIRRGDVVCATGGGGAGLGDPLWRDPQLVAKDLQDGYISRKHAAAAYGVIVNDDETVDEAATEVARAGIRRARLGQEPSRIGKAPVIPGLSVQLVTVGASNSWRCASCDWEFGDQSASWRAHSGHKTELLPARFEKLDMSWRDRARGRPVEVHDYYCPGCGSCLATDVAVEDYVAAPAPGGS